MSKLLEEVRDLIRTRHYSYRTDGAYLNWIKYYILFHDKRNPAEMGQTKSLSFSPIHVASRRILRFFEESVRSTRPRKP